MYEILYAPLVALLVFVLPGLTLARTFRLTFVNVVEATFYAASLSFTAIVAMGVGLGTTIGLTPETVLFAYLVVGIAGPIAILHKPLGSLFRKRNKWEVVISHVRKIRSKVLLVALVVVTVTALNWGSAIGTHPIDMGEHVFWAKLVTSTSRLPDYSIIEPLDQAVKFTYGSHLVLAQFFLLAGISIEDYAWIPTLVGSIGLWLGIALITHRLTGSSWAAVLASAVYGTAYWPGGYIQRGNLPDIIGYLLLVSTLYSVLRVRENASFAYPLGLTAVSVIPYHQLATVILPTIILFTVAFTYLVCRADLFNTLRSAFIGRGHLIFWTLMLLLALIYAGTVTYINGDAASQLVTGNWKPYARPPYTDLIIPGVTLGILATAGMFAILMRRTFGGMILLGWVVALTFLGNALLIGIPIPDPLRFLWRMTEPFSVIAAIFVYSVARTWGIRRRASRVQGLILSRENMIKLVGVLLVAVLISFHFEGIVSFASRYNQTDFYQDDKRIGQWLAVNASSTSVIVNDADIDQSATWVQTHSMKLHFIYKAYFGAIVAPSNYIQIYKDTQTLYLNPSGDTTRQIIQRYNITYVVAHLSEIELFSLSPFFRLVFLSGQSALFASVPS